MIRCAPALACKLATVAWVGSLWTVGLLVAPALFAELAQERALAGSLAGRVFALQGWLGAACGVLLLGCMRLTGERSGHGHRLIGAMLALLALRMGVVAPAIANLRAAGAVATSAFASLHGISALLYLIECLLGALLVASSWRGPAQPSGSGSRGSSGSAR